MQTPPADIAADALQRTADDILRHIGGTLDATTMPRLKPDQVTLLAYNDLRNEVMEGGFIQLIHNGYGPFIFLNPFAKAMRLWGQQLGPDNGGDILRKFSHLVYDARLLFMHHAQTITADMDYDSFMALYEQFPDFDLLDDTFIDMEEDITASVMRYVESNPESFAL